MKFRRDSVCRRNYPNPFNPETVINYKIRSTGFVTLKIYSMDGKEAATLVSGMQTAGSYSAEWNAGNFSSGTYFYRLSAGEYSETKKMILVR
ncbi:MAG: T9SS type A sorting domain-containing protein [Ignavibacteria bacterium]|nr:T9SS type A sorting domain-containing protein [Ignavibacteria bacterium]